MHTQAYFENIQQQIIKQVKNAKESVLVAVAWLTDSAIFSELCSKTKNGVRVELLLVNDTINNDMAPFDHRQLEDFGGKVYFVPPLIDGAIMHHKFCIIDNCTVITGSYNWSRKAQLNDENIVVAQEACELGAQFKKEFEAIKSRISGTVVIDFHKIIKRLELIKNFAALEEKLEIATQVKKLKEQTTPPEVAEIILKFESGEYAEALKLTEGFIRAQNQIAVYDDAEIFGLQLEIRSLEIQINALENEKVDAEKLVFEFSVRHTKELGKLILEILHIRKLLAHTDEEIKEAETDEEAYRESFEEKKNIVIPELTFEEKKELKKIYREASILCHPDKFQNESAEVQEQAEETFKDLSEAYENNNVESVKEILGKLKNGFLKINTTVPDKKELLKVRLMALKKKSQIINEEIKQIKKSESYNTAIENENWDIYFKNAKMKLEKELASLKSIYKDGQYN